MIPVPIAPLGKIGVVVPATDVDTPAIAEILHVSLEVEPPEVDAGVQIDDAICVGYAAGGHSP